MRVFIFLALWLPVQLLAGGVSIERTDSLIRNELFDAKRARAEEYKRMEALRQYQNWYWQTRIDPACILLKHHYLIYRCATGTYYKGYPQTQGVKYRQMSESELNTLSLEAE